MNHLSLRVFLSSIILLIFTERRNSYAFMERKIFSLWHFVVESVRVLMGLGISLFHGYGKVFGGRIEQFAEGVAKMGFPMPDLFAWAAALSELLGGILIAFGLGTRVAALFVFFTMSMAAFNRHAADPFDVKERALLYWVITMAIMLIGPGRFSLDYVICKYFRKRS